MTTETQRQLDAAIERQTVVYETACDYGIRVEYSAQYLCALMTVRALLRPRTAREGEGER